MDPVGLDWLYPELLFHLCLLLSEADITSLSQSCQHLREVLNVDQVWERFVTEEVKRLKTTTQQLKPPFHPDPNFCESRQHLQRRDHLISNWRNGSHLNLLSKNEPFGQPFSRRGGGGFYKDNLLTVISPGGIWFWDVTKTPTVNNVVSSGNNELLMVEDKMVQIDRCKVKVYQIDTKDKLFPYLYSFAIGGNEVEKEVLSCSRRNEHNDCYLWKHSDAGKYLVFYKNTYDHVEPTFPLIHIWDVVNGNKLGVFVLPVQFSSTFDYTWVHTEVMGTLILETQFGQETVYSKFKIASKMFLDAKFKVTGDRFKRNALFFQDYCVLMKSSLDGNSVVCETFEFDSSIKIAERCFLCADQRFQRKEVIDGKLVILTSKDFFLIDAITLRTLNVIPHEPGILEVLGQTSVFGEIFLVTSNKNGLIQVWDVKRKTNTVTFSENMMCDINKYGVIIERGKFIEKGPNTKFVVIGETSVLVAHFW